MREEKRLNPRIDLDLRIAIAGFKGVKETKNFSTGGLFIRTDHASHFKRGDTVSLATKLPLEEKVIKLKAEIVHVSVNGVGVRFVDLMGSVHTAIEHTFRIFQVTVPLPGA